MTAPRPVEHAPSCPRTQFWDGGSEVPCTCGAGLDDSPRPEAVALGVMALVKFKLTDDERHWLVALIDSALTAARADERERVLALIENPSEDDDGIWQSNVINGRAACKYLAAAIRAMEGR